MKKIVMIFVLVSVLFVSGCAPTKQVGKQQKKVSAISLNAKQEEMEIEVPYNPKKVAVLDMAVLDMLDSWDLKERVVGMPKASKIDYLMHYNNNQEVADLGTLKEVDMEALIKSEPDLIFIGGRLSEQYDELSKIAPVVSIMNDYELGIVESTKKNALNIASIFGKEEIVEKQTSVFDKRIKTLQEAAKGKTAIVGLVTSSNFNTLGNKSRGSLISDEIGFTNAAQEVDSTHGNEASFEIVVEKNPDYIFVLDRDSAINTEGAKLAKEIMDNALVKQTSAYKNKQIIYLTPTVWYLSEGGISALDKMLQDLEKGILS